MLAVRITSAMTLRWAASQAVNSAVLLPTITVPSGAQGNGRSAVRVPALWHPRCRFRRASRPAAAWRKLDSGGPSRPTTVESV